MRFFCGAGRCGFFVLLLLVWGSVGEARVVFAEEVVRVFLFAGQSNMVGADAQAKRIDEFPAFRGAGVEQPDVLYSYVLGNGDEASEGWVGLKPLESFGPEITFARRIKQQDKAPIAIIKSAVGGTTADFDWNPDAPEKGQKLYPRTLKLVRDSLAELDRRGIRYRLEGVMWHQGENDMLDRTLGPQYAAGLTKLIMKLREDLKAPELKWYLAEVSEKGIWGMDHRSNLSTLRKQQEKVLKNVPLVYWVPTSHLAFEVMESGQPHYHFGTQGQLQLGEAFADAYLQKMDKPIAVAARRFEAGLPLAEKSKVRLFVIAGQRNMEGEDAFASEISGEREFATLAEDQRQILYRYSLGGGVQQSKDWEPLGSVGFLNNFGPELSMGAMLRKALPKEEGLAIVKFTHSGAQGPDWFPKGSPEPHRNLYPKLLAFIQAAKEDLVKRGYDCDLAGVFWHPGENDTFFGPYAEEQAKWTKELIEQLRLDLKEPELRWFITEQHSSAPWRNGEQVNAALREMASREPHVTFVETSHLPHGKRHFGTLGTLMLGEEMAKRFLEGK